VIVDIRTYNIVPRKMAEYLALFEEHALPVQRRHIGDPLAYFQTLHGALNQVVHIWGFDSLADMEQKRAARDADPAWADYLAVPKASSRASRTTSPAPPTGRASARRAPGRLVGGDEVRARSGVRSLPLAKPRGRRYRRHASSRLPSELTRGSGCVSLVTLKARSPE
jgi:hypothetical protein